MINAETLNESRDLHLNSRPILRDNNGGTLNSLRITVVSHIFHPDELGGAALMTDLALFLQESGAEVNVVSTFPYYPRWQLSVEDRGVWRRIDQLMGIPIRRVRMFVPGTPSTTKRLFSDFSFFLSLTLLGRSAWKDADVIVTTCPMFGQTTAMRFATPFRAVPKLVIVQDFVVDAALELGMIKSPVLGRLLKGLERWAFRSCSTLTTISGEMLKKLVSIAGSDRRTLLIPNWIHGSLAKSIETRRALAGPRKQNFLFYSGNVGRKQGLPDFLSMFDGNLSGWRIRINGGGAEFEQLKDACAGRTDAYLHGLEDEGTYIESLLSCSACLVTQKPGVGANFLPSKILPALASGTPILAVCEKGSPLGREVIEAECGVVITTGDSEALQAVLQSWNDHPEQLSRYSANALQRAKRYERGFILAQYRDEILALAEKKSAQKANRVG